MATKVSLENNILKVDNGTKIEYLNASWCSMRFSSTVVYINDESKSGEGYEYPILFTDFQDGDSVAISTEATIATYLSDKIG
jgi:hypothetical protein